MNTLYYGDNLTIMQQSMPDNSIDLIYLDPPFNSNRNYNLLYKNTTGLPVPESIEAFCDTWELDYEKEALAQQIPLIMRNYGIQEDTVQFWYYWIKALRETHPKMLAYLVYMTVRLVEMHRLLKPTGSLYLHCDPTASHYIKIMMDGIFGHDHFLNEITWCYRKWTNAAHSFQNNHDVLLVYAKQRGQQKFNKLFNPNAPQKKKYDRGWDVNVVQGGIKQLLVYDKAKASEKIKRGIYDRVVYREGKKAVALPDWWEISILNSQSKERLGYPTQKPMELLHRIIQASSNEGDVVFDPFCGCGTTIESAIQNNRQWIGIDIAIHSVRLIEEKRIKKYPAIEYQIKGIPQSEEQAKYLFEQDPFQFQHWAIEKTGGFCNNKKTADRGVDGRLYFEVNQTLRYMVLSVKGGQIKPADIRELRGVLERESLAEMAGFLSLQEPTKAMKQEAQRAGSFEHGGIQYRRIQLLTIQDIFNEKWWHCPSVVKSNKTDQEQTHFPF